MKTSSPEYPRSNGLAEKTDHISKQLLRKCQSERVDLETDLLKYRCTPMIELKKHFKTEDIKRTYYGSNNLGSEVNNSDVE